MADYKLRLDVDARLLEKNLEAAVKKAFGKVPGMSGGGMGGGMSGMGGTNYQKQAQQMQQKLSKAGTKLSLTEVKQREKYIHDMKMVYIKEKAALRAHNIMLEKSGARAHQTFRSLGRLMGGRAGGAVGTGMDIGLQKLAGARTARTANKEAVTAYGNLNAKGKKRWAKSGKEVPESNHDAFNTIMDKTEDFGKNNRVGKMMAGSYGKFKGKDKKSKSGKAMGALGGVVSKVPQLVKLAGIGAALAGGAGLGKMIVDSSPMLKSMLKLLNVGVMLILRPIGDFIGFMLRPLLLHFVKEVAIPAYKKGAGLAKEWGTKMGKIILLLFTNPIAFLKGAILDPLMGSLENGWNHLVHEFQKVGVSLSFWLTKDQKKLENDQNEAQYLNNKQITDSKYPGFSGILGGIEDTEIGKNLQKLQDVTTEELNLGNEKTDKVIEQTKEAGDAVSDLEDTVIVGNESQQKTAENTTELLKLAKEQAAAALFDLQQADIASEIAQDYRDQCIAKNSDYEKKIIEVMGSKAIQDEGLKKKQEAIDARIMKKFGYANAGDIKVGPDGKIEVNISSLSPKAQEILEEAAETAAGRGSCKGPQVGSRCGMVGPMATGDMGQWYTSERYRTNTGLDNWEVSGGEECYQQDKAEYYNYATETREGMEIYSKAIAESEKWGSKVEDEWKKIHLLASETESKADKIDSAFCQTLQSSEEVQAAGTDMADNFDTVATCVDTLAATMKNAVDNFSRHEKYLASIMKQASYIKTETGETKYPGMAAAAAKMAGASLSPGEVDAAAKAMYKITFGDGTSKTQGLDPTSYKHLSDMRARGELYRGKSILSITKMAKGGIIGEKIFGIGESGQQYMFGESGPETVTPGVGGTVNNGGGSTFNITINASNTGDIERQLKPAILRMLKESTARAGIV
jgi:hypothetical protein